MTIDVRIPLPDGSELPAALAVPAGAGPHPGVIVLHEMFGLKVDMRGVAERFAVEGYVAVVPGLFAHGPRVVCIARAMREVSSMQPGQVTADTDAVRSWLAARSDVDADRLAVIGFCMGGGFALIYAATGPPGVGAASVNYGDVPKDVERLRGVCPVVASYGGRDRMFAPKAQLLERHLSDLGVPHDVKVYPRAGHSFMTPDTRAHQVSKFVLVPMRLGHAPEEAEDAWRRVFAFFAEHVRSRAGAVSR
jgi:carboxymethylenebutenolidase